jgi:hypothetical protein
MLPRVSADISVPLELPNGLPASAQSLQSFDHIKDALVTALWIEDPTDLATIPSKLSLASLVYLCISPVMEAASDGLYSIRILVASDDPSIRLVFGPLVDNVLVQREQLARLIRDTVISVHYFYKQHDQPYKISFISLGYWSDQGNWQLGANLERDYH